MIKVGGLFIALSWLIAGAKGAEMDWPQFRGPDGQGHSSAVNLPINWSETQNVKYKTEIPGRGWSSPVIAGDQIWMTTATQEGHSLRAICVEAKSGKIVRDVEVFHLEAPQRINAFNSYASPTPVIDGDRVYVCFGAHGSAALEAASGRVIWTNQELKINHMEGPGSSPVIYKNLFILHCDGSDEQYVAALDKETGKLAWKTPRTTPFSFWVIGPLRKAYGTPLIIHADGKDQLISPATRRLYSYEPQSGRELWHVDLDPPAYSIAPRPVFGNGVVYVCTGYDKGQLWAIRVDSAQGDVSKTHVLWKFTNGVPLISSPILIDGLIYFASDNGIARCVDARSGQQLWQSRIGSAFIASRIYAEGRIYFFLNDDQGTTKVLKPGREFVVLAENELGEGCLATPAISGSAILVRTRTHLYRIEK